MPFRPDNWYKERGGETPHADPGCKCRECVSYEEGTDAMHQAVVEWLELHAKPTEDCTDEGEFPAVIIRVSDLAALQK